MSVQLGMDVLDGDEDAVEGLSMYMWFIHN